MYRETSHDNAFLKVPYTIVTLILENFLSSGVIPDDFIFLLNSPEALNFVATMMIATRNLSEDALSKITDGLFTLDTSEKFTFHEVALGLKRYGWAPKSICGKRTSTKRRGAPTISSFYLQASKTGRWEEGSPHIEPLYKMSIEIVPSKNFPRKIRCSFDLTLMECNPYNKQVSEAKKEPTKTIDVTPRDFVTLLELLDYHERSLHCLSRSIFDKAMGLG
jgi:hypothetical protein